jgi:hypothetical protein
MEFMFKCLAWKRLRKVSIALTLIAGATVNLKRKCQR